MLEGTEISQIAARKRNKRGPVWSGRVSAAMLAESDVSIDQRGLDRRKLRSPEILLAQQFVNRPRARGRQRLSVLASSA